MPFSRPWQCSKGKNGQDIKKLVALVVEKKLLVCNFWAFAYSMCYEHRVYAYVEMQCMPPFSCTSDMQIVIYMYIPRKNWWSMLTQAEGVKRELGRQISVWDLTHCLILDRSWFSISFHLHFQKHLTITSTIYMYIYIVYIYIVPLSPLPLSCNLLSYQLLG